MANPIIASQQYSSRSNSGSTKPLTCAAPSGIVAGDLLLIIITINNLQKPTFFTTESGWELYGEEDNSSNQNVTGLFWKIAVAGDIGNDVIIKNDGASFTNRPCGAFFLAVRNVQQVVPLFALEWVEKNSAITTHTKTGTDAPFDNCLALAHMSTDDSRSHTLTTTDWTNEGSYQRTGGSANTSFSHTLLSKDIPSAGDVGNSTITIPSAESGLHLQIVALSEDSPDLVTVSGPDDVYIGEGDQAVFNVTVDTGTAPFTYQWYEDGVGIIGGAVTASLSFATELADEGRGFYCEVSDIYTSATSRTGVLQTVGTPGYDGSAYQQAILDINPTVYFTLDENDVSGTNDYQDEMGHADCTTSLGTRGEAGLIDDGKTSVKFTNQSGGGASYMGWINLDGVPPEIHASEHFTMSAIIAPTIDNRTPYLFVPFAGDINYFAMGINAWSEPADYGNVYVEHDGDDRISRNSTQSNIVPPMRNPAEVCPAVVATIIKAGDSVRWYVDYTLIATYTSTNGWYWDTTPSETNGDVTFFGRDGLSGGLEGHAQHVFYVDRVLTNSEMDVLFNAHRRSCSRFDGTVREITPESTRSMLVYNFEDDTFTWADASRDTGADLEKVVCMAYQFDPGWQVRWSDLDSAGTTWADLNTAGTLWSDFYSHGSERNLYWLTKSNLLIADQSVKTDGVKDYFVERLQIDLDDLVPIKTNKWKNLRQFYFHLESPELVGTSVNSFDITIGWGKSLMDTPTWQTASTINLQSTGNDGRHKWDFRSSGRYLALRMDFSATDEITMTGGDLDLVESTYGR